MTVSSVRAHDGVYALAANLPGRRLRAVHVLRAYKAQEIVERRNRDVKGTLRVRPIFLHNDDRHGSHAPHATHGVRPGRRQDALWRT